MRYPTGFMRRWWAPLLLLATLASMILAGCDTPDAPALGKPVQVTLRANGASATLGQATLTPAYGAHVEVYMHGELLPYDNPQMPAQLRQGGCYGPLVAPLTANAPADGSQVVAQPDAKAGVNIAHPVDVNWYVVVLKSTAANAPVAYCGHPLSARRQYFDMYLPDRVDNGIGYGSTLIESIVMTQVHVALAAPTTKQSAEWSIHSGGCQGSTLASGAIAPGATAGSGVAFASLGTASWWFSVALDSAPGQATCVQAG